LIDPAANASNAERISTADAQVEVRVIPTDEEAMIVRHTLETI
jgi:acetate kinase